MKVLTFCDYYLPGFKGGGPIMSVSRLVQRLSDRMEFFVVTRDRDLRDTVPFDSVPIDEWTTREPSANSTSAIVGEPYRIFYSSPSQVTALAVAQRIREIQPDVIYLNSYFSCFSRIVLNLRRLGRLRGVSIIVAPRGEFTKGALAIKALKKRAYLAYAKTSGLHRGLVWQVSSEHEMTDAQRTIGEDCRYFVLAADLSAHDLNPPESLARRPEKKAGAVSFAFLSRICSIKNLDGALDMLRDVTGDVELVAYGPAEDQEYWSKCLGAAEKLPTNVRFEWRGPVGPDQVRNSLAQHHFLLMPTKGENFGHVIPEALSCTCPVVISDRTPWRDLHEHYAGWVLPLEDRAAWVDTLSACVQMDADAYSQWSRGAYEYVAQRVRDDAHEADSERMFHYAMGLQRESDRTAA